MTLTIGFSPCPNDTFIFDALINQKIDTKGLSFNTVLEDVETLNTLAIENKLSITKISYGVLPKILKNYTVLNSGSALGKGVGPLLISNQPFTENVDTSIIAIPGENTTAHLLFSLAYPSATNKVFMCYDEIEAFVLAGKGLGVIIHENRFTYQQKGLHKIVDLGNFWETNTHQSIPLGGIVVSRKIESPTQLLINDLIKESIIFAYKNYPTLPVYVIENAQEMDEEIMRKHIDLYVNQFSVDLGTDGRAAIMHLLNGKKNNYTQAIKLVPKL
jgi:1,4-dihydroxy-6-naphthoate synthase